MNDLLVGGGAGRADQAGLLQSGKAKRITGAKVGLGVDKPVLKSMCLSNSKDHSEANDGDDVLIDIDHEEIQHRKMASEDGQDGHHHSREGHIAVKTLADAPVVSTVHPFPPRSSSELNRTQKMIGGSEKSVCSDCDEQTGLLGTKAVRSSDNSSSGGGGSGESRASLDHKSPYSPNATTAILSYSLAQQPPIASVILQPIKQQPSQLLHPTQMILKQPQSQQSQQPTQPLSAIARHGIEGGEGDEEEDSKLWFPTSLKPSSFFREEPSKTGDHHTVVDPILHIHAYILNITLVHGCVIVQEELSNADSLSTYPLFHPTNAPY